MEDKSIAPCGDKPNCISTLDEREEFTAKPFILTSSANMKAISHIASQLKGAKLVDINNDYARIECTSSIFRFVDDLELRIYGNTLIVRSESRTGYSDFGVNRKRVEKLRALLEEKGLISQ
ncbi:conserved hypothetical protein [Aliivibrio fischeri MJ11]|uniref:DUF1499 domain-containing protein n=2 Tax=Aliivibrio fischeri TaxID=668 RepID=B5FAL0_ALIFM|nr:conserved hypothetical protein [Aliivibrio fischeri MJ11]GGK35500.1 hypothetical protein GCM10007987_18610 [Aliivibrio fischeri]